MPDSRRDRPPLRPGMPRRLARGDRTVRARARAAASRPCRRAAEGDRGLPRRARLPPDRAAGAHRLPHRAHHGRACDPRGRRRARPPRLVWRSHLCVPDHRGRPRRRLPPAERIRSRAIPLCIGSDSNVRIDPFEELRELEGIARRQTGRRGVFSTDELYAFGRDVGAGSLGSEHMARDRDRPRAPLSSGRRRRARPCGSPRRLRLGRRGAGMTTADQDV